MSDTKQQNMLKNREDIPVQDTWNLELLYKNTVAWDSAYEEIQKRIQAFTQFEGSIQEDETHLLTVYEELFSLQRKVHHLATYAMLKMSEDAINPEHQQLYAKVQFLSTNFSKATAFLPQSMSRLSDAFLESLLEKNAFSDYKQTIRTFLRQKQHILSLSEEKILAQQSLYEDGFEASFSALMDADLRFGTIQTPEGEIELTHSTMSVLMEHKERQVRKDAYTKYFTVLTEHTQVLSRLYTSSVQQDCVHATIRKYNSALEASIHTQNIPLSLYSTLIDNCRSYCKELHDYYAMLKQYAQLDDYSVYDTRAPLFEHPPHDMSYDEAVALICEALAPLGTEYISIMKKGLTSDRWVDKYESKGKRSGAFSSGVYDSEPYILLNYQNKSLDQVFTLAHEAGHSMHSYFAHKANPYPMSSYTIFEAEVASTLNEYLLHRYLIDTCNNEKYKAYYLWHEIQEFTSVFFRQVMFAEFELQCHQHIEQGKPLSAQFFLELSKTLLQDYYGSAVTIPELSHILGLRIPHFYRAYYVFKYATGISAAIAIGANIYKGNSDTLNGYFEFLRSGGSRFPIESLQLAGVDFIHGTPITEALDDFTKKKNELKKLLA